MNSFGLGLVLNFTDNATSGMKRASQTFNEMNQMSAQVVDSSDRAVQSLMSAGISMTLVGDQFLSAGSSIVGVFTDISSMVINTGMDMQKYRMQLTALYGSEELGAKKMQEIQRYAQKSVFEVESLIPAVTMMKAVGIEALDDVTTSSGKSTQKLLDYASDLAAMFPNMRNTYGTGVQASMGALKEYIAEGNALSLKRGAGLDIKGILGENKGKTIAERTQQIADLIEKLNIVGYTAQLAGTPMQRLSNIQDAIFNTLSKIADGGVFESFNKLLQRASDYIFNLTNDEEKLNRITKFASSVMVDLMKPLSKVLDYVLKLADAFINLMDTNPVLAKMIVMGTAMFGVFLVAMGVVLKFAGSIFLLTSAFTQMGILGGKGISFMNILKTATGAVTSKIIPLVAFIGLLRLAWDRNFLGIRDTASNALLVLNALFDVFGDNSLSVDSFNKLQEKGLLPIIESIMNLKYQSELFFKGFIDGLKWFGNTTLDIIEVVITQFDNLLDFIHDFTATKGIKENISDISDEARKLDFAKWERFGVVVGILAGAFATAKLVTTIQTIVSSVWLMGSALVGLTAKMWTFIASQVASKVETLILLGLYAKDILVKSLMSAATAFLAIKTAILNAILLVNPWVLITLGILAVIAVVVLLVKNWEKVKSTVKNVIEGILGWLRPFTDAVGNAVNKLKDLLGISNSKSKIDVEVNETGGKRVHPIGRNRSIVGLDTGGYIKKQGVALLHPEEVVLNSNLTKNLGNYLSDVSKIPKVPVNSNKSTTPIPQSNDNRIVFEAGSVVLKASNTSDAELERVAEKFMRIIARKQALKNMSKRQFANA